MINGLAHPEHKSVKASYTALPIPYYRLALRPHATNRRNNQ